VDDVNTFWFTQGVLGISCAVLAIVIRSLWNQLLFERKEHKEDREELEEKHAAELAAKDATIATLWQARVDEGRVGIDVIKNNTVTLDALRVTVANARG